MKPLFMILLFIGIVVFVLWMFLKIIRKAEREAREAINKK